MNPARRPAILLLLLLSVGVVGEETWRFITLADWHQAEKYTQSRKNPEWLPEAIAKDIANTRMLKETFGGELILMPGDSNGGHWDTAKFIKRFEPGLAPAEAILKAGKLCYSGMVDSFAKGGYSRLLMAVGDHELGDNAWPVDSAVSRCQPQFRAAFAGVLNTDPETGKFLYDQPIGRAPSRPLGTPYAATSYAYQHKNVLFVTVDVFQQESPTRVIGGEGTVTGAVTGAHLKWLDHVLTEARNTPVIKHVFVQGHLPAIHPVRRVNSSGMMMDDGTNCPFWKTLRRHQVDIYFAGEVHANTVTKDPESDLIQLVSRGNFFNNFLTVDVSDGRIEIALHNQTGATPADGQYERSGRLVIDKSGDRKAFEAAGELAFLNPRERLLHFTFEEDAPLVDRRIVGLRGRTKDGTGVMIRGVKCTRVSPNLGTFGTHYSALCGGLGKTDGSHGAAALFDQDSRMGIFAMGPHYGGLAVSYALWIKTTSDGNQVLINSASIWGKQLQGFLNLNLYDGRPTAMISGSQTLTGDTAKLNDGRWHHLAVVMPEDGCLLSQILLYVDGKLVLAQQQGEDQKIRFNQAVRLGIGGLGYSRTAFDALQVEPFVGAMDEVSIWARGLSAAEVAALAK